MNSRCFFKLLDWPMNVLSNSFSLLVNIQMCLGCFSHLQVGPICCYILWIRKVKNLRTSLYKYSNKRKNKQTSEEVYTLRRSRRKASFCFKEEKAKNSQWTDGTTKLRTDKRAAVHILETICLFSYKPLALQQVSSCWWISPSTCGPRAGSPTDLLGESAPNLWIQGKSIF